MEIDTHEFNQIVEGKSELVQKFGTSFEVNFVGSKFMFERAETSDGQVRYVPQSQPLFTAVPVTPDGKGGHKIATDGLKEMLATKFREKAADEMDPNKEHIETDCVPGMMSIHYYDENHNGPYLYPIASHITMEGANFFMIYVYTWEGRTIKLKIGVLPELCTIEESTEE